MLHVSRLSRLRFPPRLALPLTSLVLGLGLLAATIWHSRDTMQRHEREVIGHLVLVTSAAASDIRSTIELCDLALQHLRNATLKAGEVDAARFHTEVAVSTASFTKLGVVAVAAMDRSGALRASAAVTAPAPAASLLADDFARLAERREQHILVGRPISSPGRTSPLLPVFLPLHWEGRDLQSALVAFLDIGGLGDIIALKPTNEPVWFALHAPSFAAPVDLSARRAGRPMTADPGLLARIGGDRLEGSFFADHAGNVAGIAFRALVDYGLVVTGTLDLDAAMAAPERDAWYSFAVAVAIFIVLQLGSSRMTHYLGALERAHESLQIAEESERQRRLQLDATLDAMIQGAMVVDSERRIRISNSVFQDLARLPDHWVKEGNSFDLLLERLIQRGDFPNTSLISELPAAVSGLALAGPVHHHEIARADGVVLDIRTKPMAHGGFIVTLADITEHRNSLQRIRRLAEEDPLTGLVNRRHFLEELRAATKTGQNAAVLLIDLDRFKHVNDTLGHPVGDKLLRHVAERLRMSARAGDVVARLGGDEFAILQRGAHSRAASEHLGERLVARVSERYQIEDHILEIGASVGIALLPSDGTDPEELLKAADIALYHGKTHGRGAAHFFEPTMRSNLDRRRRLENELRLAVAQDQINVHYQPIRCLATDRLIGVEALCRWDHPERGLVMPGDFIRTAEETGLILDIGQAVFETAVRDLTHWPAHINLSVNVSPIQLKSPGLLPALLAVLDRHRVPASRIELEITESVAVGEDPVLKANLQALDAAGFRIALDDFGTGYAWLGYLQRLPVRKVKIDRHFVRTVDQSPEGQAIVEATTFLARKLGLVATAEGIETDAELATVRALGCNEAQGFLLGRPMPRDDITVMLASTMPHLPRPAISG